MLYFILVIVYIASIFLVRWEYRMNSSKHLNVWLDEDCKFNVLWIIPVVNTISGLMLIFIIALDLINTWINKHSSSKWLNGDL